MSKGKKKRRVTERGTASSSGKGVWNLVCGSSSLPGDLHYTLIRQAENTVLTQAGHTRTVWM